MGGTAVLTSDEATKIEEYPTKHEYASLRHVIFAVLWKTGMRRNSLYALDTEASRPAPG